MQIPYTDLVVNDVLVYLSDEGRWFVLASAALFGAILGSFMNVVVYRMPLGLSLSHPSSRCPRCEHPIRWHDNVPVLGWLMLRGRCRDCGTPISPRYPLVETLVAAMSASIAWLECMPAVAVIIPRDENEFGLHLGLYAFHMLLMCTLVCAAWIEFDGHALPKRLAIGVLMVGLLIPIFKPDLRPVGSVFWFTAGPLTGLTDGIAGVLAALLISVIPWLAWSAVGRHSKWVDPGIFVAEMLLVGAFLGDGAVVAIGLGSMTLYVCGRIFAWVWPGLAKLGWGGPLALVSLIWILSWRSSGLWIPRVVSDHVQLSAAIAGSMMAVLAVVLRFLPDASRSDPANNA